MERIEEMYAIDDMFYFEIDEMIEEAIDDRGFETESDVPIDFTIEYSDCELRPIYKLDSELLFELLSGYFEENSSEDGDEWDRVLPLIEKHFDFNAFNEASPKLWFPDVPTHTITRNEIIEYMIKNQ